MILSVIIIGCLVVSFIIGRQRGLVRMLLRLVSFIVATMIAKIVAPIVGTKFATLFPIFNATTQSSGSAITKGNGDAFFYNGVAFIICFWLVMRVTRWLIMRLNRVTKLPIIHQVNNLAGGIINLGLAFGVIFVLLTVFQVYPNTAWQAQLTQSGLAQWIINKTPILSQQVVYWLSTKG